MLYLEGSLLPYMYMYMYTTHTNTIEDYHVTNPCTVIGQRYRTLSALANYMYMCMHDQSRMQIKTREVRQSPKADSEKN